MKRKVHFRRTLAAQIRFEKCGCKRKGEQFIEEMNELVPWMRLMLLVESNYPKQGNGRRPVGTVCGHTLVHPHCSAFQVLSRLSATIQCPPFRG
jgi:hypothetical protein